MGVLGFLERLLSTESHFQRSRLAMCDMKECPETTLADYYTTPNTSAFLPKIFHRRH